MGSQEELLARLRSFNAAVRDEDPEIAMELPRTETLEVARPVHLAIENESIAMRRQRPVLAIQNGETSIVFNDAKDSDVWKERLTTAKDKLCRAIAAVGRIELDGHPDFKWVGTGWLVAEDILVTNRHVAEEFATREGETFVFHAGLQGAAIDFLQEIDRDETQRFEIKEDIYIEERPGLDLAFLRVKQTAGTLAAPIVLPDHAPKPTVSAVTIGYPAYDSRIPEPELMQKIYGNTYDKKRLAPGAVTSVEEKRILHNCTTLGGNSGSVVLDLTSGDALGLHFSGSFLRTNYAVRADLVKQRLDAFRSGKLGSVRERPRSPSARPRQAPTSSTTTTTTRIQARGGSTSITIPLVVTVSIGEPATATPPPRRPAASRQAAVEDDVATEAKPADYANRTGYLPDFLGKDFVVELPEIGRYSDDVRTFGNGEHVLKYQHFSVVMSKQRRMCLYSACNIDGERSKSSKRAPWRLDPRIPRDAQIIKECYGNSPKFSRGHMTRREDPAWGTPATIQRGSDDSMHVTNTTPQMQSFNSPIWLGLEDYALQNARQHDMKISVFTGPYFEDSDPEMYGVRIPVMFWKIIAFVHEKTGQLCATGYEMSQEANLEVPEFVFGDYRSPQLNLSTQVPISAIEFRAGISLGALTEADPLAQESAGDSQTPLHRFEQIRFT